MIEILRNKNQTTRFLILVEIAAGGPGIQQKEIARRLDITPQAVSDYMAQLAQAGMVISEGRSHKISSEGVNWIIRRLRELGNYSAFVQRAVTDISVCTAIAEGDLREGQEVGLKMKDGVLYASGRTDSEATGTVAFAGKSGEDIGVISIEGIVPLKVGRVTILRVPEAQRGGSRKVDSGQLRTHLKGRPLAAAIGLESIVALRKEGASFYMYGAAEAAIEAAMSGLNPLVVCVENETSDLIARLEKDRISYELFDIEAS
ncbi:MAG: winged helix-turn-helix transcriptional regulator [Dehalococcoidia bacterium]|nr:winged helix-turn-helix transcriptional regulator [Dehalococcoidia bacterium]